MVFGRLTVIKPTTKKDKYGAIYWLCQCECGNQKEIIGKDLKNRKTQSCGCLQQESRTKHGMYNTRIYRILKGMYDRCYNKNKSEYKYYGGKDIKICDEWLNKENGFINFYNWAIKNGYEDDLEIDRINTNGNYEPNNCRWVNHYIQMNNTNRNINITINDITKTIAQWSKYSGVSETTIIQRLKNNITDEELIKPSIKCEKTCSIPGVTYNKNSGFWMARITINGETKYLGSSKDLKTVINMRLNYEKV